MENRMAEKAGYEPHSERNVNLKLYGHTFSVVRKHIKSSNKICKCIEPVSDDGEEEKAKQIHCIIKFFSFWHFYCKHFPEGNRKTHLIVCRNTATKTIWLHLTRIREYAGTYMMPRHSVPRAVHSTGVRHISLLITICRRFTLPRLPRR